MKKIYYILILCLVGVATFSYPLNRSSGKQPFPRPRGAVNDFASLIPVREERMMENLCKEVWQKTRTAIVVATVDTVGDSDYETYANELYANWGIGERGKDKGVLIFLTKKERKIRIETGYGVEGILPDGLVGQIRDENIVPFLKKGEYGKGLLNGTIAISQIIARDAGVKITGQSIYTPRSRSRPQKVSLGSRLLSFLFFIILFFVFIRNPFLLPFLFLGMGGRGGGLGRGSFGGFSGGFGGFGGGLSGGGGAGGSF